MVIHDGGLHSLVARFAGIVQRAFSLHLERVVLGWLGVEVLRPLFAHFDAMVGIKRLAAHLLQEHAAASA